MRAACGIPFLTTIALGCALAAARVQIPDITIGWEGQYRPGMWTPIYITALDDEGITSNVRFVIRTPFDGQSWLSIREDVTVGPAPTTFIMYVPLGGGTEATLTVLDRSERRELHRPRKLDNLAERRIGMSSYALQQDGELLIGVSGERNVLQFLERVWDVAAATGYVPEPVTATGLGGTSIVSRTRSRVGFIRPYALPDVPQGYEGLDILVLNAPDLISLSVKRQQAIATWVRAGGRLLFWAGDKPVPEDSLITRILPCRIGQPGLADVSPAQLREFHMPERMARLPYRRLTAVGDGKCGPLLGISQQCTGRAGLGQVTVLGIDGSLLYFNSNDGSARFWRPIIRALAAERAGQQYWVYRNARTQVANRVIDRLGDAPGVGRFSFSFVAIGLVAMILLVGPVDWFVLKRLNRHPWTWGTMLGCIMLITGGALALGHVLRSGDLQFRTVHVVEQADGRVVAVRDAVGIYSPRTREYGLQCPADGWWGPLSFDFRYGVSSGPTRGVPAVQDTHGNHMLPDAIPIWNLRFYEGQSGDAASEPPAIRARLKKVKVAGATRLQGTITNLSPATLHNVLIRIGDGIAGVCVDDKSYGDAEKSLKQYPPTVWPQDGAARSPMPDLTGILSTIGPGRTVTVDVAVISYSKVNSTPMQLTQWLQSRHSGQQSSFAESACQIEPSRWMRMLHVLAEQPRLACIIAEGEIPGSKISLLHDQTSTAKEQHWLVVSAVVELE